jgi:hypothetical protein
LPHHATWWHRAAFAGDSSRARSLPPKPPPPSVLNRSEPWGSLEEEDLAFSPPSPASAAASEEEIGGRFRSPTSARKDVRTTSPLASPIRRSFWFWCPPPCSRKAWHGDQRAGELQRLDGLRRFHRVGIFPIALLRRLG